jgi:hypothetical protein
MTTFTHLAMIVFPLSESRPSAARSKDTKSSILKLQGKLTPSSILWSTVWKIEGYCCEWKNHSNAFLLPMKPLVLTRAASCSWVTSINSLSEMNILTIPSAFKLNGSSLSQWTMFWALIPPLTLCDRWLLVLCLRSSGTHAFRLLSFRFFGAQWWNAIIISRLACCCLAHHLRQKSGWNRYRAHLFCFRQK